MPPPSPDASDWWLSPSRNALESSTAYGLAITNAASAASPATSRPGDAVPRRQHGGGDDRQHEDARRVLGGAGQAQADSRDRVPVQAAVAVDDRHPQQRQAHRGERRHVVEREVRVVHGQERHREQRARDQRRAGAQQQAPRPQQQAHRGGPQHRADDPRQLEHARAVDRQRVADRLPAPPAQVEHRVQQVRVGGRVDEVARVVGVPEHPDGPRHEVGVLVGVVDVRQPVSDPPQPQPEREREDAGGPHQPPGVSPQHATYAE